MIASLRGTLLRKQLDSAVIEAGGVGYRVFVSSQTQAELPPVGREVRMLCHTHVREDALQIFGFMDEKEQRTFELLIQVSGVGPKLALTMLSGMPVLELARAIVGSDHRRLQTIPGVGRKTAERVVVELKDRLARDLALTQGDSPRAGVRHEEVVEALINLGYKRAQAEKAVAQAASGVDPAEGPEQILRRALQSITELSHG